MRRYTLALTGIFTALGFSATAAAQSEAPPDPGPTESPKDTGVKTEEPAAEEESTAGVNADVQVASAYIWRGTNVWGPDQSSQNLTTHPSVTGKIGSFAVGYWGAYQLSGSNRGANLDAALGAEQDLFVSYGGSITDELGYSFILTYYVWPAADEAVVGTSAPMFLEPGAGISYSTAVDLGLNAMYYRGLQEATTPLSFVYIRPSIGKKLELTEMMTLALGLGAGYKIFTNEDVTQRTIDVQADVALNVDLDAVYVAPGLHSAWTNIDDKDFGDELAYWAGVSIGKDISF